MGHMYCHTIEFKAEPPLLMNQRVNFRFTPMPLADMGLNIRVGIFPAQSLEPTGAAVDGVTSPPMMTYAHFDTGATISSIDHKLAAHLKLKPTGMSDVLTAGGRQEVPNYVIDLFFPGSSLKPFISLPVSSCHLEYDIAAGVDNPRNFAMLLGRDVMSQWNITWNGPESAVTIND